MTHACTCTGIEELQEALARRRAVGGRARGGGEGVEEAIALDELRWLADLFRHERQVFSQVALVPKP